jgi:hypothetical protein
MTAGSVRPKQLCNNPHTASQAIELFSSNMNLASLADLQSFAAVARLRSFRKAAAELGPLP